MPAPSTPHNDLKELIEFSIEGNVESAIRPSRCSPLRSFEGCTTSVFPSESTFFTSGERREIRHWLTFYVISTIPTILGKLRKSKSRARSVEQVSVAVTLG